MLKKLPFALFISFLTFTAVAQFNIDSVRQISDNIEMADSLRAKAYIELADYSIFSVLSTSYPEVALVAVNTFFTPLICCTSELSPCRTK